MFSLFVMGEQIFMNMWVHSSKVLAWLMNYEFDKMNFFIDKDGLEYAYCQLFVWSLVLHAVLKSSLGSLLSYCLIGVALLSLWLSGVPMRPWQTNGGAWNDQKVFMTLCTACLVHFCICMPVAGHMLLLSISKNIHFILYSLSSGLGCFLVFITLFVNYLLVAFY